jgi:hypothetical protein
MNDELILEAINGLAHSIGLMTRELALVRKNAAIFALVEAMLAANNARDKLGIDAAPAHAVADFKACIAYMFRINKDVEEELVEKPKKKGGKR